MRKQLQKFFAKKKNNKGFTLIELIIVIAILAILVGIVGMASIRYVEKSRVSADKQTLDSVSTAAQAALVDPDLNITVQTSGTVKVDKDGNIKADGFSDKDKLEQEIKDSLAKTPKLKSQAYKDGRTMDVTTSGSSITVSEWH